MDFGQKLKEARKAKGLTQGQVAEIICTTQRMITRYEQGETEPTISRIKQFCLLYGVSADWLIGITSEA